MPYTKKNYPNTYKNIDEITRLKAIDILNAMIKDGYEEENAIPIALSQAKKWAADADGQDKEALKRKDITKHKKKETSSAHLQNANITVYYDHEEKMWAVKSEGAKKVAAYYKTKKEALKEAQTTADYRESQLISYTKDGKKQ